MCVSNAHRMHKVVTGYRVSKKREDGTYTTLWDPSTPFGIGDTVKMCDHYSHHEWYSGMTNIVLSYPLMFGMFRKFSVARDYLNMFRKEKDYWMKRMKEDETLVILKIKAFNCWIGNSDKSWYWNVKHPRTICSKKFLVLEEAE